LWLFGGTGGASGYKNGALSAIYHAEGRVVKEAGLYVYQYTLRDHLGNGRVYFTDKLKDNIINDSDILQDQTYYTFGGEIDYSNYTNTPDVNKYQYNGKELNDDFGLNLNHHDWRWYDPNIGRWWVVDPKLEEEDQESLSPYHFSYNNPVRFSDPDGQCPTCITALAGAVIGAAVEVGSQMFSGKSISEVDWADVGVEAVKGGIAGSGAGAAWVAASDAAGIVAKASWDYTKDKETGKYSSKHIGDGSKSINSAVYDGVSDLVVGKVTGAAVGALGKAAKNSAANSKVFANAARDHTKFAADAASKGNQLQAKSATNAAKSYAQKATIEKVKDGTNKAVNSTVGKIAKGAGENIVKDKIKESKKVEQWANKQFINF
jgi:RHS repeat-associated protein